MGKTTSANEDMAICHRDKTFSEITFTHFDVTSNHTKEFHFSYCFRSWNGMKNLKLFCYATDGNHSIIRQITSNSNCGKRKHNNCGYLSTCWLGQTWGFLPNNKRQCLKNADLAANYNQHSRHWKLSIYLSIYICKSVI